MTAKPRPPRPGGRPKRRAKLAAEAAARANAAPAASSAPTKASAPVKPAKPTKPSVTYSQAIGDEICRRLADGEGLAVICKTPGMPDESSVRAWALDVDHPFSAKYSKAREVGWHRLADEVIEISDDRSKDVIVHDNGTTSIDHEHINRARLRVDSRKWLLARVLPKIYGEKLALGGDANLPLTFKLLPGDERA